MTTRVTATVVNGMLKPDEALPLADQSRVRLTIEPVEEVAGEGTVCVGISAGSPERASIHGGGVRYTRYELYERR